MPILKPIGNRTAETMKHSALKHLMASILERAGHKVAIEGLIGSMGIGDIVDKNTGYVYEIQSKKQKEIEAEKTRKYCLNCSIKDVIFIYVDDYDFDKRVWDIMEQLSKKAVI